MHTYIKGYSITDYNFPQQLHKHIASPHTSQHYTHPQSEIIDVGICTHSDVTIHMYYVPCILYMYYYLYTSQTHTDRQDVQLITQH